MTILSGIDSARIEAAVANAEEGSTGEIVCVVAGEVSTYRETPLVAGLVAALVVPPLAMALGLHPLAAAGGGWTVAQTGALEGQLSLALGVYALGQTALFALVAGAVSVPVVRRALTPGFLKTGRVRKAARQQFAAVSARAAGSETGILIFVAPVDRRVELVADVGIHEKVGDAVWRDATAAIGTAMRSGDPTAGIVTAVGLCGEALRQHFPAIGPTSNVMSNRPLEI
jgi:putative membrane protein